MDNLDAPLSVFVASVVPATIVYSPYIATGYSLTAACMGDTLILNKPTGLSLFSATPFKDLYVACTPSDEDSPTPTVTVLASGPSPLTWVVTGIDNTQQCGISYGDPTVGGWPIYSLIMIYPRPKSVLSLTCANCSRGYRSSPGDSVCTECGLGYFSNPVSETCTACPVGTKCPNTTTSAPVDCGLGFYQPQTTQYTCLPCPVGQYCDSTTTVTPINCPAGTYRGSPGAASTEDCSTCPTGNFCPSGSVDPTNCSAGKYNTLTGQPSSASCLPCPAGDFCPVATTTPSMCSANTFTAATGASLCDQCPIFSTSPIASTNCTCDAGHYHDVVAISGAIILTVAGDDTYLTSTYPGNTAFVSLGEGLLSYPQIVNSMSTLLVKGGKYRINSGVYGGVNFGLKLYSQLSNINVVRMDKNSNLHSGLYFFDSATFTTSVTSSADYIYSTGVAGQGTNSLNWDTSTVPSGLYFIMTDVGLESKRFAINVFVASLTPVTLNYEIARDAFVPIVACLGDTIVISRKPGMESMLLSIICYAGPTAASTSAHGATAESLTWLVDRGSGEGRCVLTGIDLDTYSPVYSAIFIIYPRPSAVPLSPSTSSLTCSNCSSGYRSSPGDSVCTECGLGYYSNPVSQTCTACPAGTKCPSATTPAPVDCGVGFYQPEAAQSDCMVCPVGQYCDSTTTVTPTNCQAGTYRGSTGAANAADCSTCPSGNFCPSGSVDPTNCTAGKYNTLTGQGSSAACLPCPAGDFCPEATTTPSLCAANTFTASTGAATCDQCPIFSTSPTASTNCTCDAGHYHQVVTTGGSIIITSVVGADTYLASTYPGNTKFASLGDGLLSFPLVGSSIHTMLVKGGMYSLQSAGYGGSAFGLKVFSQLSGMGVDYLTYRSYYNKGDFAYYVLDYATFTTSVSSSDAYLYATGVSGQGSGSLTWDTSTVPSGMYFLMTDIGQDSKRYAIDVFVASLTPVSFTYQIKQTEVIFLSVCIGDSLTFTLGSYVQAAGVFCQLNDGTTFPSTAAFVSSYGGGASLAWTVNRGVGTERCVVAANIPSDPTSVYVLRAVMWVYPRPTEVPAGQPTASTSSLTCPNCSSGYRSDPGAPACVECGLGYYSNPVSQICTACPVGTKCPSATTPAPVNCGVGFYQPQSAQSVCLECPVGQYCALDTTVTPVDCPAGSYRSTTGAQSEAQCNACTTGHFCPVKSVIPADCISGTYNPSTSMSTLADCLVCSTGKYSMSIASATDCPPCQANYYCPNSTTIKTCPDNTVSDPGKSSLLDCRCKPGFSCTYTKQVTAVVKLNSTTSSFNNDVGGVKTAFIAAVAKAAGVPISAVHIGAVSASSSSGRRLLSLEVENDFSESIQVYTTVTGATKIHNLGFHLAKHDPSLHLGHTWQENHSIRRTALLHRPVLSTRL